MRLKKDPHEALAQAGFECIQELDYKSLFDMVPARVSLWDTSKGTERQKQWFDTLPLPISISYTKRWIGVSRIQKHNQIHAAPCFKFVL